MRSLEARTPRAAALARSLAHRVSDIHDKDEGVFARACTLRRLEKEEENRRTANRKRTDRLDRSAMEWGARGAGRWGVGGGGMMNDEQAEEGGVGGQIEGA